MSNAEELMALLKRAHKEGHDEGYKSGCSDTYNALDIKPVTEDQAEGDGIPVHNIENPIVREYFAALPEKGYTQSDISRMWHYTRWVKESSRNMAERGCPYVIYGTGDSVLLECEGEEPQTIMNSNNVFECFVLLPNKLYRWKMLKSGAVIKEGAFKTVGDVRQIGFDKWTNFRDIGGFGIKHGLVYSGANPDEVEVDSKDHELIKYLGIDTQLNLRKYVKDSTSDKSWRPDIFDRGYNINIEAYAPVITRNTAQFKKAFETLVSELKAGRKVVFNCWAGADRTGTFRYVIQGICGVPKRIAQGYYELTSFSRWLNTKMWDKEESSEGELRTLDKKLESLYGSDFYTQCYRLLTEKIKVAPATIKELQDILKE